MGMQFPPGKKTPQKYPSVGPNYGKWGEQEHNGYVYNPQTDTYYYDPVAAAKWKAEAEKEIYGEPPKPPGIWEQAAASTVPILATAAAVKGGEYLPGLLGLNGAGAAGGAGLSAGEAATSSLMAGPVEAPIAEGVLIGPGAEGVLGSATTGAGAGLVGLGGYGLYKALQMSNKDKRAGLGALSGAGMGLGGGMLAPALGLAATPLGWPALGLLALGGGLLGGGAAFGLGKHKSTKEIQAERQQALRDRGVTGYAEFMDQLDPSKDPEYGMVKDKNALTWEDVVGSEGVWSTYGNDWMGRFTADQRKQIAERLLQEGLFDTDKGDVVIFSENQDRARQLAKEITGLEDEEEKDDATV